MNITGESLALLILALAAHQWVVWMRATRIDEQQEELFDEIEKLKKHIERLER